MFRKFTHLFVVTALIAVTGGHWALLQTVAWTNMLAVNLRSSSLEIAVTRTFDGRHPCGLCKAISSGRQSEKKSKFPAVAKKLEYVPARSVLVFAPPQEFWLLGGVVFVVTPLSSPPPSPPPRSLPV